MTESETTSPVSSPKPPQSTGGGKTGRFARRLLGMVLLVGLGAATVSYVRLPIIQTSPELGEMGHRLDVLEAQVKTISEAAQAPAPQPVVDTTAFTDEIKKVEAQLEQTESKSAQDRQTAQKLVATAFTFWDLRAVAQDGRVFDHQLSSLLKAASGDEALVELAVKLEPYAATPTPTVSQLRETLTALEAETPAPVTQDTATTWWARIKTALQPLVSVRPLHNARFVAVEKALDAGDAPAALDAVKALPEETKKNFAAWQTGLEARIFVDETLQTLTAYFTAPPQPVAAQGGVQ